ncbi:MAG: hypothetical protein JNL82_30015 [Myxococcales bacterium]|nr:hypothetical protein [Myxococcales bacterium]
MLALYRRFFAGLPVRTVRNDGHLHLLNADEIRTIRRRHRQALVLAALLSVCGFLAYFLPVYALPGLFPSAPLSLPWIGEVVFPWAETLWGLLLMVIEIYLLVLLNLWGVHEIAVASGLIDASNKEARAAELIGIGLEDRHQGLLKYGIDPFLGLHRGWLFVMNLVLRLKGFLGSKVLRYLVQRWLGRFAVREVLDFVGMPIYMAINAYSTHAVLREARVIIMGQKLIEHLGQRVPVSLAADEAGRELIYDTLEFIAVSKRDFHQNHFLLTRALVERYAIKVKPVHPLPPDYADKLRAAPGPLREACTLLIVLGFVLDGQLSLRERRRIARLREEGVLPYTAAEVQAMCAAFMSGEGVEGLISRHLG